MSRLRPVIAALLAASGTTGDALEGAPPDQTSTLTVSIDDIDDLRSRLPSLAGLRELNIEASCKGDRISAVPLPDNLGDLTALEVLRIGSPGRQDCDIRTTLPASLARLRRLRVLEIDDAFEAGYELPAFLGELRNLEELRLWRCHLKAVPEFVGRLTKLRELDLSWNEVTHLPGWLAKLEHLGVIGFRWNGVHSLPPAFAKARVGTALYRLGNNRLSQRDREAMVRLLPRARFDFTAEYDEPEEQVEEPQALGEPDSPYLPSWCEPMRHDEAEVRCEKPIGDASRRVLGLRVEHTLVETAERSLGPSPLHRQGDAGESLRWRCWEAANGDGTVLVIGAGEVHGLLRIVGPDMPFGLRGSCPKSTRVHRRVATASGVRLGLARSEVEAKVGPASRSGTNWYERVCMTPTRMTDEEVVRFRAQGHPYFTSGHAIRVVERNGRAAGIEITWSETY
ncbi:MAG: leucine-rich repeat domain-containing protein [Deltaproteobacteria bacterium]|nr:leucine-rich repeat domain-containing protein [Deltaproteobacteria bacterium]